MSRSSTAAPERGESTAAAIEALAHSAVSEDVFFRTCLARLVDGLAAAAGAVWFVTPQGIPALGCELRLADVGVTRDPARSRANLKRLMETVSSGKAAFDEGASGDARQPVSLTVPLASRRGCVGVIQLFLDAGLDATERLDAQQLVEESAGSVARYLAWREVAGSPAGNLDFFSRFEAAIAELHGELSVRGVAARAVNEGRRLLECDRVSLVLQRGRKAAVVAVSGQSRVNGASNAIRGMANLAASAIRSNRPIASGASADDLPLPVEALLLDYLKSSGTRMVKVIPLAEPQTEPLPGAKRPGPRAFGALVIEQVTDEWLTPVVAERADRYAAHVARAVRNATTHESVFLLTARRAVGKTLGWFRGRRVAAAVAIIGLLATAIVALAVVPAPYRVEGKGRLMPVVQRDVFAPWDGEVVDLFVEAGDRVEPGQPLVTLRNDDLQSQLLLARNRLAEKRQQRESLRAEVDEANRRARPEEAIRLRGRLAQTEIELEAAGLRARSLEAQVETLTVRAPIAGTVATYQLDRLLANRPVRRGETLLEIMDEEGDWRLEAAVPEHRMGHILAARKARRGAALPVEFVLATNPEATHAGRLDEVATRTSVSSSDGTVVHVQIAVSRDGLPARRIGAEAVARIDCGRASLAWILFGDMVEFVQKRIW